MTMRNRKVEVLAGALLAFASAAAAEIEIYPLTTRWTFGAHEPYTMYRRVGNHCTGGIDGNAQWVQEWLDWFDDKAPEVMEGLGLNFLHSRFYKGMGWEVEKKDFPNVRRFVANCHAHGVRALAYVQFGTLYPEAMRREIPQVDSWAGVSETGGHTLYCNMYFRWMPCLNCREWEDYLKRMCTIALTEGGFDGIMFDNVFDAPCYCARCERAFREHLKSVPDRQDRFGFEDLDYVLLPRIRLTQETKLEVQDPVAQEWLRWRADVMTGVLMRLRDHIKKVKPDAIVSGNPSPYRNRAEALYKAQNMAELCRAFDFIIMQNTNFPEVWANGVIRNRVRDLKFAQDMGQRVVALCDNVEHLRADHEAKFLLPMVEDIVFGGIPTERVPNGLGIVQDRSARRVGRGFAGGRHNVKFLMGKPPGLLAVGTADRFFRHRRNLDDKERDGQKGTDDDEKGSGTQLPVEPVERQDDQPHLHRKGDDPRTPHVTDRQRRKGDIPIFL